MQRIFSKKLLEIKEHLDDKETELLEKRLLSENPLTLQEIGDKYHITKERVRQIENRLKKKIRHYMEETMPDFAQAMLPYGSREDS
jgi:RNA polymerase sigma-32 factor